MGSQDVNVRIGSQFDRAGVEGAKKGLGELGGASSSTAAKFALAAAGALAAVKGLKALASAALDLGRAYGEQERVENRLAVAVHNNPLLNGSAVNGLKDYASELQRTSIFGDEQIIQQAQFLASMELTEDQIKATLQAAVDFASTGKGTLESAVQNLAKTYGGLTGELGELVPELKDLTKEELEQGKAVEILQAKYEGMALTVAGDSLGALEQFNNAWGDLKEGLGSFVMDILEPAVRRLTEIVNGINAFIEAARRARNITSGGRGPGATLPDLTQPEYLALLRAQREELMTDIGKLPTLTTGGAYELGKTQLFTEEAAENIADQRLELELLLAAVETEISRVGDLTASSATFAEKSWTEMTDAVIASLHEQFAVIDEEAATAMALFGTETDTAQQKAELLKEALLGMVDAGFNPDAIGSVESGMTRVIDQYLELYELLRTKVNPELEINTAYFGEIGRNLGLVEGVGDTAGEKKYGVIGGAAEGTSGVGSMFGQVGSLLAGADPILILVSAFAEAAMSVESVSAVLNGLTTALTATIEIIGPSLSAVLIPVIDLLILVGDSLGKLLAPILTALAPIIGSLIQILSTVLVPIFQVLFAVLSPITMILEFLQPLFIGLAIVLEVVLSPLRFLGDLLEWIGVKFMALGEFIGNIKDHPLNPGKWGEGVDWGGEFSSDAFTGLADRIAAIAGLDTQAAPGAGGIGDVTQTTGTGIYGGGTNTYRQPDITVYLHAEHVYGAGGIAEFGRIAAESLVEYTNVGGRLVFLEN